MANLWLINKSKLITTLKQGVLLPLVLLFSINTLAQNKINNPSFEDIGVCPDLDFSISIGGFAPADYAYSYLSFWEVGLQSPDFFSFCASHHNCKNTSYQAGVPFNSAGFQYPKEGNNYVGMYICAPPPPVVVYLARPKCKRVYCS